MAGSALHIHRVVELIFRVLEASSYELSLAQTSVLVGRLVICEIRLNLSLCLALFDILEFRNDCVYVVN